MMHANLVIPAHGSIDFLSLGALVHRLDPGMAPFRKATAVDIHVSGGEFNVAANLSDCTGSSRACRPTSRFGSGGGTGRW